MSASNPPAGDFVIRIDGNFLYQIGAEIRPLLSVTTNWNKGQVLTLLWPAESRLDTLLNKSVYRLLTSWHSGTQLLGTVKRLIADYLKEDSKFDDNISWADHHNLTSQAKTFETVLSAELQLGNLYLVQPKGGYDLMQLAENGVALFPPDLIPKVPEAIADARHAARCIAFELPTAAAFHLHRLHELVLRRYYDVVTGGKARPEKRNIGAYIDALKGHGFKDQKVFGALAGLKNFHRNPVLHPDDTLEDIQEAIALLGNIVTVVTYMLKTLQPEPLKLTPPPSDETPALEDKSAEE